MQEIQTTEEKAIAEAEYANAQSRNAIAVMNRYSIMMLRITGDTWPVRGIAWTASVKARALSSTSNAALKTARMDLPKDEVEV